MASQREESDLSVSSASQSHSEEEKKSPKESHEKNEKRKQPRRRNSAVNIANLGPENLKMLQGHDR